MTAAQTARGQGRWLVAALVLLVAAGVAVWWVGGGSGGAVSADRSAAASATSSPSPSPSAPVTEIPLPTEAPAQVPQTVLVDAPQLPPNLTPVALAQTSAYSNGVSARLVTIGAFDSQAHTPGELSGPALAVTVELANDGDAAVTLDTVGVNLYYGADGTPAVRLRDGSTAPMRGHLAPGDSVTATYSFSVPTDGRDAVTVAVSFAAGDGTALFSGPVR
jgi:hypothetical protein